MSVKDDSDFLSVFSRDDSAVISSEVAEFIENSASIIHPKEELTLRIHSNCIDDDEKLTYTRAIRSYYLEKREANKIEIRRNYIISLILLIAGIAVLAFSIFLNVWADSLIWSEVIDIAAWVLLWECVDICVFKNMLLRINRRRYSAFISMIIEFIPA